MARNKFRRQVFAQGGIQIGASATRINSVYTGTVTASVPQIAASGGIVTGSLSIPGVTTDSVILLSTGSGQVGPVIAYGATACAAGNVSASFASPTGGATGGACDFTFHYVVFDPE